MLPIEMALELLWYVVYAVLISIHFEFNWILGKTMRTREKDLGHQAYDNIINIELVFPVRIVKCIVCLEYVLTFKNWSRL